MSCGMKNLLRTLLDANAGCGGCGSPKLSGVYEPEPKPKPKTKTKTSAIVAVQNPKLCSSSTSSDKKNNAHSSAMVIDDDLTSTTSFSFNIDTISTDLNTTESEAGDLPSTSKATVSPKIIDSSVAVVKDSNDPYQDFRDSMLQMIVEKRIYSKDDLQELLQCFLELNSACHHHVIVKAFMEIWNQELSL